MHHNLMQKFYC